MATIGGLLDRAGSAYGSLATVGEEVEDEWQYVQDLTDAWRAQLDRLAAARGGEPAPAGAEAAVDRIIDEVGRIIDPHRAIDWLSTFPQVVLLAVDGPA